MNWFTGELVNWYTVHMNELKERIQNLSERLEKAFSILNLEKDRAEIEKLSKETEREDLWDNPEEAQKIMQHLSDLKKKVEKWDGLANEITGIAEMAEITAENDHEMIGELEKSLVELESKFEQNEFELLFSGEFDKNNAIIQISGGAGGTDAQDWAQMLERMYLRFIEKLGFTANILQRSEGEEAGIKSATVEVKGLYAYGYLKSESGVHRLVRLSPFDADKARHTSFAQVEVIPEIEDLKFEIDEKDLKIDTYKSGGHGGQSVNTTDSAVRITHLPTGIVVTCQNERSQLQNKQSAMKVLASKLADLEQKKKDEEMAKLRGENVSAGWGNQIRSYVLHPYNLVKDHRTGFETADTTSVLDGDLDLLVESYLRDNQKS